MMLVMTVLLIGPTNARSQFFYMENEDIGKPVKEFTLKIVNKEKTSLQDYRSGEKALIFFWATWCPHCRVQLKELNEAKDKIAAQKIKIVAVDVGEDEGIVNKYLQKNGIALDVFLDEQSDVSDSYGLVGVPTFYFVDEQGIVAEVTHSLPEDIEAVFNKT